VPVREREHEREQMRGLHAEPVKEHARRAAADVEVVELRVARDAEEGHRAME